MGLFVVVVVVFVLFFLSESCNWYAVQSAWTLVQISLASCLVPRAFLLFGSEALLCRMEWPAFWPFHQTNQLFIISLGRAQYLSKRRLRSISGHLPTLVDPFSEVLWHKMIKTNPCRETQKGSFYSKGPTFQSTFCPAGRRDQNKRYECFCHKMLRWIYIEF